VIKKTERWEKKTFATPNKSLYIKERKGGREKKTGEKEEKKGRGKVEGRVEGKRRGRLSKEDKMKGDIL
jgi:hypothetical protein